ncbi:MAG: hypothetical protein RTU30_03745 [Candidatus Thorarchaeota archaeon]
MEGSALQFLDLTAAVIEIVILPAIAFGLGWFVQRVRRRRKFRRFLRVFGFVAENPENIVLILPLWALIETTRDDTRFKKVGFDGKAEEYYGPTRMIAFDDLEASAQVASILAEFYPAPIKYSIDNDPKLKDKTIILLGEPLANTLTQSILEGVKQPYFEYVIENEKEDHSMCTAIRDKTTDELFDTTGVWQYSMVLRIPNPESPKGYVFVVSGALAMGTLAASSYLKEHWEDFAHAQPSAGVLLKTPQSDFAHYLVVKRYGFLE